MNLNIIKLLIFSILLIYIITGCADDISIYENNNLNPNIYPDYTNIVIPPNIAPLNFKINETGNDFNVVIYSENGEKINIHQSSPSVSIPIKKWKKLLDQNKENNLFIDIYVYNGGWLKFNTITDSIATEEIDSYLAYRLINTVYIFWREMGIYQRNIENFDETPIFVNSSSDYGCVNCHFFSANNPEKMTLHFRKSFGGTIIYNEGNLQKINTKTKYTMSNAVYPAWHPGGNIIAYSVNIINQNFASNVERVDIVSDQASDIVLYNIETNTITTSPKVSTKSRENLPTWSPDGKWLYFISAPEIGETYESRAMVKYSLLRISYNVEKDEWGDVDTVLSANKTGKSITHPKVSSDGQYVTFAMIDFGYFSIYDRNSDIYILDLNTREFKKAELNSTSNESSHSWSSDGRWLAFSSKRLDNIYSRTFFSYFDNNGKFHKPFVLPQKEPLFYNTFLKNFNLPQMITGKINVDALQIRDEIRKTPMDVKFDTTVQLDALSGATKFNLH